MPRNSAPHCWTPPRSSPPAPRSSASLAISPYWNVSAACPTPQLSPCSRFRSRPAALSSAIESRDPVTALTAPSEVSAELIRLLDHPATGRVFLYPVVVRSRVPALIYAWGSVQGSAIELLGHVAAAVWSAIPEPTPPPDLVGIAPAPAPASSWDGMPADEQRIHLRAQRFARVQVAEMRLFEADAVQSGRAQRSLYEALGKSIDAAREIFRKTFFASCASMVDYLDLELTRTLANDNPDLLGKTYPGPLR